MEFRSLLAVLAVVGTVTGSSPHKKDQLLHFGGRRSNKESVNLNKKFRSLDEGANACDDIPPCSNLEKNSSYRSMDGRCNNVEHPDWGMAVIPFRRLLPTAYADQKILPRTGTNGSLPNARTLSTEFHAATAFPPEAVGISHMVMQWGQFLDNDLTLSPMHEVDDGNGSSALYVCCIDDLNEYSLNNASAFDESDICMAIDIPVSDAYFADRNCLNFVRSLQVANAGCTKFPAEQLNQITAFVDGSNVYGSSLEDLGTLKQADSAHLTQGETDMLPEDSLKSVCVQDTPDTYCYKAGDVRVNEQVGLMSMHTIWMRQHNLMVDELQTINPHWNTDTLFQEARKIVGAMLQIVTYKEFLPVVLGNKADFMKPLAPNSGYNNVYNEKVDPSIYNAFSTAAYRFGHSLVRDSFGTCSAAQPVDHGHELKSLFGRTSMLQGNKSLVDDLVCGLASEQAGKVDQQMSDQLTKHLFEKDGKAQTGHDLAALNIQRGRDHGLRGYLSWRQICHELFPSWGFETDIHMDPDVNNFLLSLYDYQLDDIDLFTGGLAETAHDGEGIVGPTFACILVLQFKKLRAGDRYWFERPKPEGFSLDQLNELRKVTLSRVICDTTDTDMIQPNAFMMSGYMNQKLKCSHLPKVELVEWKEN